MTAKLILVHDLDDDRNKIVSYIISKTPAEHKTNLDGLMHEYQKRNVCIAVYDVTGRTIYDTDTKWTETKISYKK